MTALTAMDRKGLCPQQQQHEKREEINLFQFKPASEKKCHRATKGKQNASKEKDEMRREQERRRESLNSLFHLRVAC